LTQSPLYYVVLGLLGGAVGFRVGWRLRIRWLLPSFQGLMGFLVFVVGWRMGGAWSATQTGDSCSGWEDSG